MTTTTTTTTNDEKAWIHVVAMAEILREEVNDLRLLDLPFEINAYCDDLESKVALTVESFMRHMDDLASGLIERINSYRFDRLAAVEADRDREIAQLRVDLDALSFDVDTLQVRLDFNFEPIDTESLTRECARLGERVRDAHGRVKSAALGNKFLMFRPNRPLALEDAGLIGKLELDDRDDPAELEVKSILLDANQSRAVPFEMPPDDLGKSELWAENIVAMLFLHNGWLALSRSEGPISIWNVDTSQCVYNLVGPDYATATSLVQYGDLMLVSGTNTGKVRVWQISEEQMIIEESMRNPVTGLYMLPDRSLVGVADRELHVWKYRSDEPDDRGYHLDLEADSQVDQLSNGFIVISRRLAGGRIKLLIRNLMSRRVVKRTHVDVDGPCHYKVMPNAHVIVLPKSNRNCVLVHDLLTGCAHMIEHEMPGPVRTSLAISDRSLLLVCLKDQRLPLLAPDDYKEPLNDPPNRYLCSQTYSAKNKLLVTGGLKGKFVVWTLNDN